jgi:LacI family transcriptional regulator
VLNGKGNFSDETRKKILEKVRELDYFKNIAAKGLKQSKNFVISIVFDSEDYYRPPGNSFWPHIVRGVIDILKNHGYSLILSPINSKDIINQNYSDFYRADGLIIVGPRIPQKFILNMKIKEIPLVLIDNELKFENIDCIFADNFNGGYLATKHLIEKGHKNIACFLTDEEFVSFKKRIEGYKKCMIDNNLKANINVLKFNLDKFDIESKEIKNFITLLKEKTSGLFCVNDVCAISILKIFKKFRVRIPKDIALIGFDNLDVDEHTNPPLSTININKLELGELAAKMIIEKVEGQRSSNIKIILDVNLIERNSTA